MDNNAIYSIKTPPTAVPTETVEPLILALYWYDGQGNLTRAEVNGVVTLYVSPNYVVEINDTVETTQKYYAFGSMRVAMRTITGETNTLQWMLSDHLGSTSIIANTDGSYFSELRYSAFGEIRFSFNITPTDYRYTGQLSQATIGLYYYGARWYDPALGRFVQADTIVPGAGNPMAWDRYAYVLNNPIRLVDPSGHDPIHRPMVDNEYSPRSPAYKPGPSHRADSLSTGSGVTRTNPAPITNAPAPIAPNNAQNAIEDVFSSLNWSLQTPDGITLYESPGYRILSGCRIYYDPEVEVDNGNDITMGPSSTNIGQLEFGPNSFGYETGRSSIGAIASAFGLNIGNPLAPWRFDIHARYSTEHQGLISTTTIGYECVVRPDNMMLGVVPIFAEEFIPIALTFLSGCMSNPGCVRQTAQ
jgi:RHS repeat-associated protein